MMAPRFFPIVVSVLLVWPAVSWAMTPTPSPLVSVPPLAALSPSPTPEDRSIEREIFAPAIPFVDGVKNITNWLIDWFSPSHLKKMYCDISPTLHTLPYVGSYLNIPKSCPKQSKVPLKARPHPTYSPGRQIF